MDDAEFDPNLLSDLKIRWNEFDVVIDLIKLRYVEPFGRNMWEPSVLGLA